MVKLEIIIDIWVGKRQKDFLSGSALLCRNNQHIYWLTDLVECLNQPTGKYVTVVQRQVAEQSLDGGILTDRDYPGGASLTICDAQVFGTGTCILWSRLRPDVKL